MDSGTANSPKPIVYVSVEVFALAYHTLSCLAVTLRGVSVAFAGFAETQIETCFGIALVARCTALARETNIAWRAAALLHLVGTLGAQVGGTGNVQDDLLQGTVHGAGSVGGLDVNGIDLAEGHQQMFPIGHLSVWALPFALNDAHSVRVRGAGTDGRLAMMDQRKVLTTLDDHIGCIVARHLATGQGAIAERVVQTSAIGSQLVAQEGARQTPVQCIGIVVRAGSEGNGRGLSIEGYCLWLGTCIVAHQLEAVRGTGTSETAANLLAVPRGAGTVSQKAAAEALNATGVHKAIQMEALRCARVTTFTGDQRFALAGAVAAHTVGSLGVALRFGCLVATATRSQWVALVAGSASLAAASLVAFVAVADDITIGCQLAATGKVISAALWARAWQAGNTSSWIAIGTDWAGLWHVGYTVSQPRTALLTHIARGTSLAGITNVARWAATFLYQGGTTQSLVGSTGRVQCDVDQFNFTCHGINVAQANQYILHIGQYHHNLLSCRLAAVGLVPVAWQERHLHLVRQIGQCAGAVGEGK